MIAQNSVPPVPQTNMNDPWLLSWQECQRVVSRIGWRIDSWWTHRRLAQAERQLGELGWQQAHFDPRDTCAIKLQTAEQQQSRLLFDIADTKEQIAELHSNAEATRQILQTALQLAQDNADASETHALKHIELLNLERSRQAPLYLLQSIEKSIANAETQLRYHRSELHTCEEAIALHEKQTAEQQYALQLSLKTLETEIHTLQRKKTDHFSKIGRELADADIAPLNQPEILTRVLSLRKTSARLQQLIDTSDTSSRQHTWAVRFSARIVLAILVFATFSFLYLLVSIGLQLLNG